jgi:hypothetical protein
MARRTRTYAIRLAVEGGGQVKAELVSVGQSGEQSLKRIERAGERASGGLKGLGRQAELLRTGIRTLGGALIGAATVDREAQSDHARRQRARRHRDDHQPALLRRAERPAAVHQLARRRAPPGLIQRREWHRLGCAGLG